VRGDAATTASNILASELLFRVCIICWLIVLVADVIVAWGLYVFLKPVSRSLSLLTAWFRLVFVAIAVIAVLNLFSMLQFLSSADNIAAFQPGQLNAQAMTFLSLYDYGFNVGFIFFGVHILGLGYLIYKSDYVPRILGVLLMIAFCGYLTDSVASFLSSNYANNEKLFFLFVAAPAVVSEFSLAFWLLWKGGKAQQTNKKTA